MKKTKTARPIAHHKTTTMMGLKPVGVIRLDAAEGRRFLKMLSQPAPEPNAHQKAAIANYRRLIAQDETRRSIYSAMRAAT